MIPRCCAPFDAPPHLVAAAALGKVRFSLPSCASFGHLGHFSGEPSSFPPMDVSGETSGDQTAAQKASIEVVPATTAVEEDLVSERAGWDGSNVTKEEI